MFDINFYMKSYRMLTELQEGRKSTVDGEYIYNKLEKFRNPNPIVYNIETTNACNMECEMCPRTTKMTRPVESLEKNIFIEIINQLIPFSKKEWEKWVSFVSETYGILPHEMSENHFFLYIIPQVVQLHGYGDPLLDKNLGYYIKLLSEKGLKSYFSCNPANIDINKTLEMFENGLDYIKYSIESIDDFKHKKIRGKASNFTESFNKIKKLVALKEKNNYKTTIIITMLDLNKAGQKVEFEALKECFQDMNVYIYMKSEDQQWYRKDYHGTNSIHWSEICKHPWMSMTVKSDAKIAMCMEDYNNEIILGDAKKESLYDIWNGEKYAAFRRGHISLRNATKCSQECDMDLVGQYVRR